MTPAFAGKTNKSKNYENSRKNKSTHAKFFKILRSIGLALLAISGTIVAAPIVLPLTVAIVAGYMAVAGGVLSAVSQMTVVEENQNKPRDGD